MIRETFICDKYIKPSLETDKGSLYYCHFDKDEYLHVFFYGINQLRLSQLTADLLSLGKNIKTSNEYISFLKESNGALLYSASVNLFGYDDGSDVFEDTPSSIVKMNMVDKVARTSSSVLYIGNCPCSKGGNINFYLDLDRNSIQMLYNEEAIRCFDGIQSFFMDLHKFYDDRYLADGRNENYGNKEKFVYNNIQKYIV